MGGSTVIEGIDDRASMVETQKTFDLLGKLLGIHFQEIFFFLKWAKVVSEISKMLTVITKIVYFIACPLWC